MENKLVASDNCINIIASEEALRLTPYNDANGWATIGWGHLIRRGPVEPTDETISKAQAVALLHTDLRVPEATVNEKVTVQLNQNQFDALVDFVFNVGAGNFEHSSLLRHLNAGNFAVIPASLMEWIHDAKGLVLAGLVKRRKLEAELFVKPV